MTSPPCASPASPPRPPPPTPPSSRSQPSSHPSPPATAPSVTSSMRYSTPRTSIPKRSFASREHAITITLSLMKLSDYVIQFIASQGVRHVFLVTGGGAMHLNQSLGAQSAIQPVCNSHEQASAICAEAYAKATNHLGVCMFTPDGRPLGMRQLGVQEVDIVSIVAPITKYAVTVLDPLDIRYHLEKATYLALHGRPGPVWIDIPLDVQAAPIPNPATLCAFDPAELSAAPAQSNLAAEISRLIEKLNQAERPLLFAGNGIRLARATAEFEQLRTLLGVPTVATWCAADLVPSDDPTYVGRPGAVAARGANFALQNSDFLLAIGVRLDFAITGYAPHNLAREAYKVAVDIDAAELGKLHPYLQQPVCADAKAFLTELLKHKDKLKPRDIDAWLARCADWKTRYPVVTDEHRKPEGLVSIFNLAEVLGEEVSPNDRLVVGNSGSAIEIYLLACPTLHSQRLYHTAGLGAMGYAIPM